MSEPIAIYLHFTQNLIKNERKVTNDIRKDKRNKKLWDVVNILRGKGKLEKIDANIYNQENEVISDAILQFWS